jgi:DNA-directed RNA polymerase omega subunit
MVYQPVEDLLPKAAGNKYKLVKLVSQRALELADGAPRLVEAAVNEKLTTTAMHEVLAGKVVIKEMAEEYDPANIAAKAAAKKK